MIELSYFHSHVIPRVPGATIGMVNQAIRDALIEWCEETACHQASIGPVSLNENQSQVLLTTPSQTIVHRVLHARLNGTKELIPAGYDFLVNEMGVDWEDQKGEPRYVTTDEEGIVRVAPYPDYEIVDALNLRVSVRPTDGASFVADFLGRYKYAISRGALAILMSTPGSYSYSDAGLAGLHRTKFVEEMEKCATKTYKSNTRQPIRVKPHFF